MVVKGVPDALPVDVIEEEAVGRACRRCPRRCDTALVHGTSVPDRKSRMMDAAGVGPPDCIDVTALRSTWRASCVSTAQQRAVSNSIKGEGCADLWESTSSIEWLSPSLIQVANEME